MPNWTPQEDCTFRLFVRKSGATKIYVYDPNGVAVIAIAGTSSTYRLGEFSFRQGIGWVCVNHNLAAMSGPTGGTMPIGTTFLPTTNNPVTQQQSQ